MKIETTKLTPAISSNSDDEIDLRQIIEALIRRWVWVASGGTLGLILASFQLLTTKPVYQGEFQILLEQDNNSTSSFFAQNSPFAALAGLSSGGPGVSIKTELQILNSPSVLRPVFDAVKSRKEPEIAKGMRFQSWASTAITAKEKKGTTVLNVQFRDTDKQLILPITQMISEAYQRYSNRGKAREISNVIRYLEEQINIYIPRSKESTRVALDYGFSNGLGLGDGLPLSSNVAVPSGLEQLSSGYGSASSVEVSRTKVKKEILQLELQISAAKKAGAGSIYFASQLAATTDKSSTFDKLTAVETRLAELRSRFKDNDPLVQKLERERKTLINYINVQTIALLEGKLDLAKANLKSLNRPRNVLAKHRELTQAALRDDAALVSLQNQLKQYQLEQARAQKPWELISSPTLRETPVSPIKELSIAIGLFAGIVFGAGGALLSDRKTDRIFNSDELHRYLPGPLLERLPWPENMATKAWKSPIQLLADGPLSGSGSVALIPVGDIDDRVLGVFATELQHALSQTRKLIVSRDLLDTRSTNTQLLITTQGAAKREQLRQLRQGLALQGTPIAGWVLLDRTLKVSDMA